LNRKKTFEHSLGVDDLVGVRASARCLIVALTICSWIAISNHCAIRALTTKAQTAQTGCPFHSKPAKPQPEPAGTACCKILRALPTTSPKNLEPVIIDLLPVSSAFHQLAVLEPRQISLASASLDTGPPGETSLTELNRSLHAHAPPIVS
jgi:hypothetical protein